MSSKRSKTYLKNLRNHEKGIALIAVLWVLLLVSGLAGAAALVARTNAILTHKRRELAQAEAAADAAIVDTIGELSDEKLSRHPPFGDQARTLNYQGVQVSISISNEAGRIDVNTADDDLILAFLLSRGVGEDRATTLLSDLRAAERVSSGPAPPGSLRSVQQLRGIPSWAEEDLKCWSDSLTVYTGLRGVNADDATDLVQAALSWGKDHRIGNRNWADASGTPSSGSVRSMLGEVIRVVATSSPTATASITASSEWIGRLTGDAHRPTLTMRWGAVGSPMSCRRNREFKL